MNPKYPIYIVSKGRWESRLTSKALEMMDVPYHIVIEKQEYHQYAAVIDKAKILVLDKKYQDEYDTFDELGYQKSKGPGAARNFAWQHSLNSGFERHWVLDDNIRNFRRLHKNQITIVQSGACFRVVEDFVDRYKNVAMAGLQYDCFVPARQKSQFYTLNTRIYSCNLIKNDVTYRWRGRYNEDTDLSLRMLKDGWCTVLFKMFLCKKVETQTVKGGNTKEFYEKEGTLPKSKLLFEMHPDVTRLVWRFGRWHHCVDYRYFKKRNQLILKEGIMVKKGINEYGLRLVDKRKRIIERDEKCMK